MGEAALLCSTQYTGSSQQQLEAGMGDDRPDVALGIPDLGMRAVNVVPEGTMTHQGLQQKASVRSVTQHQEMTSGYPGNRAPGPGAGLWLSLVPWGPAEAPADHSSGSYR